MADKELRDANYHLLGKIRQRSDGTLEGRDASGCLKGTYNPKRNETRDANGRLIGKGNLLAILITRSV